MRLISFFRPPSFLFLQMLLVFFGLTVLALYPPARGRILLVPINAQASHGLIAAAIGQGARLVERGPFRGSMIVYGQRAALFAPLAGNGIVAMAAPAGGCGSVGGQG